MSYVDNSKAELHRLIYILEMENEMLRNQIIKLKIEKNELLDNAIIKGKREGYEKKD
jgi:flagellar biosynthesis/type III secretory pathway protein FliH